VSKLLTGAHFTNDPKILVLPPSLLPSVRSGASPGLGAGNAAKGTQKLTPVTAVKPGKGVCKAEHNAILINAAFVLEKLFP
jgi:hypothetical protein